MIEEVIGDIRDKELVEQVVEKCDIIIHLAAQVSVLYPLITHKKHSILMSKELKHHRCSP